MLISLEPRIYVFIFLYELFHISQETHSSQNFDTSVQKISASQSTVVPSAAVTSRSCSMFSTCSTEIAIYLNVSLSGRGDNSLLSVAPVVLVFCVISLQVFGNQVDSL